MPKIWIGRLVPLLVLTSMMLAACATPGGSADPAAATAPVVALEPEREYSASGDVAVPAGSLVVISPDQKKEGSVIVSIPEGIEWVPMTLYPMNGYWTRTSSDGNRPFSKQSITAAKWACGPDQVVYLLLTSAGQAYGIHADYSVWKGREAEMPPLCKK